MSNELREMIDHKLAVARGDGARLSSDEVARLPGIDDAASLEDVLFAANFLFAARRSAAELVRAMGERLDQCPADDAAPREKLDWWGALLQREYVMGAFDVFSAAYQTALQRLERGVLAGSAVDLQRPN